MLFVIVGHDTREAREKRPALREAHLDHYRRLAQAGRLESVGPLLDGEGSLAIVAADSLGEAWDLVAADPYVRGGVFGSVEVRPFRRVFPAPPSEPS